MKNNPHSDKRIKSRGWYFNNKKRMDSQRKNINEMINKGRDCIFISKMTGLPLSAVFEIKKQLIEDLNQDKKINNQRK